MSTYRSDPEAIRLVKERALALFNGGSERISIKECFEHVRKNAEGRLTLNNSDTARVARDLLREYRQLEGVIETRSRAQRGPNMRRNDLAVVQCLLDKHPSFRLVGVVVEFRGRSTTMQLDALAAMLPEGETQS